MSLAAVFLANAPEARRTPLGEALDLEGSLARLVEKGRSAWPKIPLAEADFAAYLGRVLRGDAAADLAALRGDDLWLACAYGRGVPGAAEALERRAFTSIAGTLARIGAPAPLIADVLQELRKRLIEMQDPAPEQKVYAGRGDLVGWLRVTAVREANHRRERRGRELPLEVGPTRLVSPELEPELALLQKTYKRELTEAFQEALSTMSSRERNLLRYHFVEGMSLDDIGRLYRVHRATAWRWIGRARDTLCERTRDLVSRRVSISDAEFQRVVVLIESQVHVQLAAAAE